MTGITETQQKHNSQLTAKKTQIIGARIDYNTYNLLEVRCLEKRVPISALIQQAVKQYLVN